MDDISTRTVFIAVGIFVSITIVTLVIMMFSQMKEIYGVVITTDNSIHSRFDDIYSMYHGRVESGIGLLNAIKKFEEDNPDEVVIMYPNAMKIKQHIENHNATNLEQYQITESEFLKNLIVKSNTDFGSFKYEDKYDVTVEQDENEKITITYTRK